MVSLRLPPHLKTYFYFSNHSTTDWISWMSFDDKDNQKHLQLKSHSQRHEPLSFLQVTNLLWSTRALTNCILSNSLDSTYGFPKCCHLWWPPLKFVFLTWPILNQVFTKDATSVTSGSLCPLFQNFIHISWLTGQTINLLA